MDRRGFLTSAAAAAAAGVLAKPLRAQNPVPPSDRIHMAIIGAGAQGRHMMEESLKTPGVRFTAVCDIYPPNRDQGLKIAGKEAKPYNNFHEMLAKEKDLQAVLVALPEHLHQEAAVAGLRANLHVFCEKPMAYTIDEAKEMIHEARSAMRILQIGQQRHSNPLYYLAHTLLQKQGIVGEITRVDAQWDRWTDWRRPVPDTVDPATLQLIVRNGYPDLQHLINWRLYKRYSGGLMTENGTHQIDAAGWLLGHKRPRLVSGFGAIRYPDGRETWDVCAVNYLYDGQAIVRYTEDFHEGLDNAWNYGELFLGPEGGLRITAEQEVVFYPAPKNRGTGSLTYPLKGIKQDIAKLGAWHIPGLSFSAAELAKVDNFRNFSYKTEMASFFACIRQGITEPVCSGLIGLRSIVPTITANHAMEPPQKVLGFTEEMFNA